MDNGCELDELLQFAKAKGFRLFGKRIGLKNIVFEERVRMNCFYCAKYNYSWKCPPNLPQLDYERLLGEFDHLAVIYYKEKCNKENFAKVRQESSVYLHRGLLECEKYMYEHNNATALSFIGGSCKLCRNGCAKDKCADPYHARSPVEALGINIIKSARNVGIEIGFPVEDELTRMGLLAW